MKLTPLDIRHKEFSRAMRGYKDLEVDEFLDEIVEEFERLFNENIDYRDRLDALEGKMEQYQNIEDTLKKTLVSAQQQADELKQNAQKESDLILRDAELKSRTVINDSYAERQKVQRSVQALKQKYEELRYQIRNVIESYINIIEQEEGAAELEELDEMIDEQDDRPPRTAAAPVSEPEAAPASERDDNPVTEGDVDMLINNDGSDVQPSSTAFFEEEPPIEHARETEEQDEAEEQRDETVRISSVEIEEEKQDPEADPFADLDTDTDDSSFKW
jgi:cell division initiation protein